MRKIIALLVFLMLVSGCASSLLYNHYPPKTQAEFNSDSYDCNYIATNSGHSHSTLGVILDATFYNGEFRKCMEKKYGYVVEKEKSKESSKSVAYSDVPPESPESQRNYYNSEGHFSFILSNNWEEVPKTELSKYEIGIAQAQGVQTLRYAEAFQIKGRTYFSYPHFLIEINKEGKIPESELERYTTISEKDIMNEVAKTKVNYAKITEAGKIKYNKDRHMITMRIDGYKKNIGKTIGLAASFYSNYGWVGIYFYTTERDVLSNSKYFNQIVDSFKFDEGYNYIQGNKDSTYNWKVCSKAIVLKSESKAKEIHNRVLKGEDFKVLAKKYSIEEDAYINCFSLGDVKKWDDSKALDFFFNPELEKGILDGEIHKRKDGNYYILKFYKVID